jgi:hypothetical protein
VVNPRRPKVAILEPALAATICKINKIVDKMAPRPMMSEEAYIGDCKSMALKTVFVTWGISRNGYSNTR